MAAPAVPVMDSFKGVVKQVKYYLISIILLPVYYYITICK